MHTDGIGIRRIRFLAFHCLNMSDMRMMMMMMMMVMIRCWN